MIPSTANPFAPQAPPTPWRRMLRAALVVFVLNAGIILVWRATGWPGAAFALGITMGFGTAFGARFGATGRLIGPKLSATLLFAVLSSVLFVAINVLARR